MKQTKGNTRFVLCNNNEGEDERERENRFLLRESRPNTLTTLGTWSMIQFRDAKQVCIC